MPLKKYVFKSQFNPVMPNKVKIALFVQKLFYLCVLLACALLVLAHKAASMLKVYKPAQSLRGFGISSIQKQERVVNVSIAGSPAVAVKPMLKVPLATAFPERRIVSKPIPLGFIDKYGMKSHGSLLAYSNAAVRNLALGLAHDTTSESLAIYLRSLRVIIKIN